MDDAPDAGPEADPVVSCSFEGGTLSVYEERIVIDRSSASMFGDKTIPLDEVRGVGYSDGLVSGHVQIEQVGVESDDAGFLTHPIDENTLHFPRSQRACARRVRDAVVERANEA